MQIQGVLTIEGRNLHVYIDAPDDARDIFVTDLPPHALILTRERLRVDSLGFSQEIRGMFKDKRIRFLSDLVDDNWEFMLRRVDSQYHQEIREVLGQFIDAVLIPFLGHIPARISAPEQLERDAERLESLRRKLVSLDDDCSEEAVVTPPEHQTEKAPIGPLSKTNEAMDHGIPALGLPAGVAKELRERGIKKLSDFTLKGVGRKELNSLRYGNEKMTERIALALAEYGFELPDGGLNQ